MALDPQAKFLLEQMEAAGAPPMSQLSPEEARLTTDFSALAGEPEEVGKIENKKLRDLEGKSLSEYILLKEKVHFLRWYTIMAAAG